jgi:23S rRNA pseudouridine2605 synthase
MKRNSNSNDRRDGDGRAGGRRDDARPSYNRDDRSGSDRPRSSAPREGGYDKPRNDGPRKPYAGGSSDGPRKPYKPYMGGNSNGDAPRKPFERKPYGDGGDRKPYGGGGDRKPYAGGGDRKPYAGGGDRKPYGDKPRTAGPRSSDRDRSDKPYGDRKPFERKPYAGGDRDDRPRDGDGATFERKPYDRDAPREPRSFDRDAPREPRSGEPRSFDRDNRDERPARPVDRKPFDRDAPREPRSFDRDAPRDRNDGPPRSFDRKPFNRDSDSRGDRPARSFDRRDDRPSRDGDDRRTAGPRPFDRDRDDRPRTDSPRGAEPRSFDRDSKPRDDRDAPRSADRDAPREPQSAEPRSFDRDAPREPRPRTTDRRDDHSAPRAPRSFDRNDRPRRDDRDDRRDENGERIIDRRTGHYKTAPNYNMERMKKDLPQSRKVARNLERERESDPNAIRLNRYIANAGVCSRREADELIAKGDVQVNGTVITEMGYRVKPGDVVKYGNKVLNPEKMVYLLLNKPKDYITTTEDPEERSTVMDLVSDAGPFRLYPVGRLDRNTTGLLLMTNDGELAGKLTHPSNNVKKVYQVEIDKPITDEHFEAIRAGLELEDGFIKPDDLAIVTPDAQVIGVEIHSGRNRIVRRMFESLGYEVTKLDRTVFAGLTKKELPRGKWRFLDAKEVVKLKYLM